MTNTIGIRIRELRLSENLSQKELGLLLTLSQDTISLWENDKSLPSVVDIIKLCKIFKVSADFILGIEE